MTSPADHGATAPAPARAYADRTYRSLPAVVAGIALLLIAAVMLVDALVNSELRIAMTVLAGVVAAAPLIVAFTLRPTVRANSERLTVRNPFRTVVLPWAAVSGFHAGYSSEVRSVDGRKFQLWSIPVSLRARRRAAARQRKAAMDDRTDRTPITAPGQDPNRSWSDSALDDLRALHERNEKRPEAQGEPKVSWSWPIYLPLVAGIIALIVLSTTG